MIEKRAAQLSKVFLDTVPVKIKHSWMSIFVPQDLADQTSDERYQEAEALIDSWFDLGLITNIFRYANYDGYNVIIQFRSGLLQEPRIITEREMRQELGLDTMKECKVCQKPDNEKPMTFRGEDWCCERHRKILAGELKVEKE